MIDRIQQIEEAAAQAVDRAGSSEELERVRIEYLGRKAELPQLLRGVAQLPPEERGRVGKAANQARRGVEAALEARKAELDRSELDTRLAADVVDVTLPGTPAQPVGRLHVLTQTRRELEDIFVGLGFRVVEGPEVETVHYNFDALNHDQRTPRGCGRTRSTSTDDIVLRTHTSPMQTRAMEQHPPPLTSSSPGALPARQRRHPHAAVPPARGPRGRRGHHARRPPGHAARRSRARSSATTARSASGPTSSPSPSRASSSTSTASTARGGFLRDGSRCPLCKGEGWIELLGAGEVDPNVFEYVREYGYDPERHQGFAWGMGIERIAALKYGVPDLRLLYENDLRFLEQFG